MARCLKMTKKSLIQHCERRYLKLPKNGPIWRVFRKPEACGQTVFPDMSVLIGQKLVENMKIDKFKCDILDDFSYSVLQEHYDDDYEIEDFQDVSFKYKSFVWKHFLQSCQRPVAKCKLCGHLSKISVGGSTAGMNRHLKNKHPTVI